MMRPRNTLETIEKRSRILAIRLEDQKEPLNSQELQDLVLWVNDLARWLLWQQGLSSHTDRMI